MDECAFCDHSAKMSAEHITSEWMGKSFPGLKEFKSTDRFGKQRIWRGKGLDLKVKVVCESCNNGWMSNLESQHAKPTMLPMMLGEQPAPFSKQEARSLALFAFKSAVILDCAQRHREPFLSRRIRHAFRENLVIPSNVAMWLAAYVPHPRFRRFDYKVSLHKRELTRDHALHMYVSTFGFGALAFQVIAYKQLFPINFVPLPGFDDLAAPFWPSVPTDYIWPGSGYLGSFEQFVAFHERWNVVAPA